jgi:hypothetical protein
VLQIAWVIGGGIGITLPLVPRRGFGVISALLVLVVAATIRIRMVGHRRPRQPASPQG